MSKFVGLNNLLAKAGIVPAAAVASAPEGDTAEKSPVAGTIATEAQLETLAAAAHAEGISAANARYAAVLGSDAGKANHAYAMHLLADAELAALSADKLIGMVAAAGPAAKPTEAKVDDKPNAGVDAKTIEAATPKVDLKTGQAAGQTGKDAAGGDEKARTDMLDAAIAKTNGTSQFGASFLPGAIVPGFTPAK